jgi:hypothetical protein
LLTVKASSVCDLKASGNHASDQVWEVALKARLLLEHIPSNLKQELEGLECVAAPTKDNKRLSLILRRNIGELTVSGHMRVYMQGSSEKRVNFTFLEHNWVDLNMADFTSSATSRYA